MMRKTIWISAFVFAATLGIAVAATRQSAKVAIPFPVSWAGQTLSAGTYTVRWQGDADTVDVTILREGEVVAQGRGRLEQENTKPRHNAVVTRQQGAGAPLLTRIKFEGKTTVLVLAES